MAVPKGRVSKSKRDKRKAQSWKIATPNLVKCSKCGELMAPHQVCTQNMKSQAYRMALLYDFYGDVLTPRQKEFYDLYYNEDLSLAEIAENNGITRQGVRDVIVRAEAILTDLEDKTGLIKRFHAMQKQLQEVESAAQAILARSARYDDPELEAQARKILDLAQQMEKE